ncbi:MAG: YraN family protein [Candidatus Levybacteria bacterium]|nr:YraN family protein [Candidatus Levybacteria bacterium]MBI2421174.1 YraN family protein [Candidatus Levybacteria bacterium]
MRIVNPTAIKGENIACDYLRKKGYKIIERNFRKGYGEIDIIAIQGRTLVFVEVKTRSTNLYGTPFEQISYFKLKSLIKTAEFYKHTHKGLPDSLRIDAVGILLDPSNNLDKIELIENISG